MTTQSPAVGALHNVQTLFDRTTSCFEEADAGFRPRPEMMSVAEQIAHSAQTVDWFLEGAFRPEGFDMNFEAHFTRVREVSSLQEARDWWARAVANAIEKLGAMTDAELDEPLPAGIMEGLPRRAILPGIADHTAHHRGALSVYARLVGKVPSMPYA
jgi:uncharacterized damage-inducible protein DinB